MNLKKILLTIFLLLPCTAWPKDKKLSFVRLKTEDINLTLGGRLKEDYFFYQRVRTLSDKFFDQNDFFRHKLQLDFKMDQGAKKNGVPTTEAAIRLTNYVIWQQNYYYTPFSRENIRSLDLDSVITANNVGSKTLMPIIYVEDAWFKLNFDSFWHMFNKNPTFFKIGFFEYEVGRGISLGYHDDMSVEYLGWPGQSNFTRFPQMPPGMLLHSNILSDLAFELYFMKWHENDANLEDVTAPTRAQRLGSSRTERGSNKDRNSWVLKFQYTPPDKLLEDVYFEPYWIYTRAPDQMLEFDADASSHLQTFGAMLKFKKNNFDANIEFAGQAGEQDVYGIDRNIKMLGRNSSTGAVEEVFSHVVVQPLAATGIPANLGRKKVPVKNTAPAVPSESYEPERDLIYIVNSDQNRNVDRQGQEIIGAGSGWIPEVPGSKIYNSNLFGNARFRKPYKLDLNGFMAIADLGYTFDNYPFRVAGTAGHISGDNYPYNDENNKTYHGFIPQRSRYKGLDVRSTLIFDRLVIPRPLNICYRTMYAFNNLKDVSNLEFLGIGGTWYPFKKRTRSTLTANCIFFWEDANLYKWDKDGHHPDPSIEAQIAYDRAKLGFRGVNPIYKSDNYYKAGGIPDPTNKGWLSNETASRFLGAEIDLKGQLQVINECKLQGKVCMFIPGGLYKDLDGQPNELTQYVDTQGLSHYESLGHKFAFAFIVGLDYTF